MEEILATHLIENTKDTSKSELSWLFNQSGSSEPILVNEACQTILKLTLKGILSVNESINALTTSATTAKYIYLHIKSLSSIKLACLGIVEH